MARLYKRGDVWVSDIRYAVGNGKYRRVRKALSSNKEIAQKRLADLIEERRSDKYKDPPSVSWQTFKERFLLERAQMARPTYTISKRAVANLEAYRPLSKLSDITPELLAAVFTHWKAKGRGLYIRNREIQALKQMMKRAEELEYIQKREWKAVRLDREPRGRLEWWTADQIKALKDHCKGLWRTVVMLGARAGLRRSEIYFLEWSDVDFERNRIHIAPKPGWNPKDYERRWIPMTADLAEYLRAIPRTTAWVLGDRPSLESMSVYFKRLVDDAGLSGSIHTLRHSFGSHLASAGVSIYVIKELMGHSDVTTTMIYSHLSPASLDESVTKLPPI